MLYANLNNQKITATPSSRARCPVCSAEVLSKCGEIYSWHWAHVTGVDCDPWYESESEWHRKWKEKFPEKCREVTVGNHRADIRIQFDLPGPIQKEVACNCNLSPGSSCCRPVHFEELPGKTIYRVIELQTSTPSVEEIREREAFYDNMIWLVRGDDFVDRFDILTRNRCHDHIWSQFDWKHPRVSWAYATKPVLIDFSGKLFQIVHMGTRLADMEHQLLDGNGYGKWVPAQILVDSGQRYHNYIYEKVDREFAWYFNNTTVEFGRYRDQLLSTMIQDQSYCSWFMSQPDLRQKQPWLEHFIMNVRPQQF